MRKYTKGLPAIQLITMYPITEELVYKIIKEYPRAFDARYHSRYVVRNPKLMEKGSNLAQALEIVSVQNHLGRIRRKENGEWHITLRGRIYLLYVHKGLTFWGIVFGVAASVLTANIVCNPSVVKPTGLGKGRRITPTDSAASVHSSPYR